MTQKNDHTVRMLEQLDSFLKGEEHLFIIVHNSPDPDAIASAAALG